MLGRRRFLAWLGFGAAAAPAVVGALRNDNPETSPDAKIESVRTADCPVDPGAQPWQVPPPPIYAPVGPIERIAVTLGGITLAHDVEKLHGAPAITLLEWENLYLSFGDGFHAHVWATPRGLKAMLTEPVRRNLKISLRDRTLELIG